MSYCLGLWRCKKTNSTIPGITYVIIHNNLGNERIGVTEFTQCRYSRTQSKHGSTCHFFPLTGFCTRSSPVKWIWFRQERKPVVGLPIFLLCQVGQRSPNGGSYVYCQWKKFNRMGNTYVIKKICSWTPALLLV